MRSTKTTTMAAKQQDTLADVKLFLETRHKPTNVGDARRVEIVCSSAKHNMDAQTTTTAYRLFSQTIHLDPKQIPVWPRTTNVCCWHCTEPFDTTPVSVPKTELPGDDGYVYVIYGVFCSGNCGARWIVNHHSYDRQHILLRFKKLLIDVFQCPAIDVFNMKLAPEQPFVALTKFGGPWTIEQFREKSLTVDVEILTPPFVSYDMVLREHARDLGGIAPSRVPPTTGHQIHGLQRPSSVSRRGRGETSLLPRDNMSDAGLDSSGDNLTGVCNGLVDGGLFVGYLNRKTAVETSTASGAVTATAAKAATAPSAPQQSTARKGSRRRAAINTNAAIAEAKATGNVQGTLAQFIRVTK